MSSVVHSSTSARRKSDVPALLRTDTDQDGRTRPGRLRRVREGRRGFTLIVLLDSHYTTLRLHDAMTDEVLFRQLLETTVARAEVAVLAGSLAEEGDFGERYADYTWSFEATPSGDDELVLLYEVNAFVDGPEESRSLKFYVYDLGAGLNQDGSTGRPGSMYSGRSSNNRRSSSSGSRSRSGRSRGGRMFGNR